MFVFKSLKVQKAKQKNLRKSISGRKWVQTDISDSLNDRTIFQNIYTENQ